MARYVDGANGLDSNDGTSLGTAWKTLSKAGTSAPLNDDVYVRYASGHVYAGLILSRAVKFHRYAGDARPKVSQSTDHIISISASGTMFDGFEIYGAPNQWGSGLRVTSTTTTANSVQIMDCVFHDNRSFGLYVQGGNGTTVTNCEFYACDSAVQISGGGTNVVFDGCNIHDLQTMVVLRNPDLVESWWRWVGYPNQSFLIDDPTRYGSGDRGANAFVLTGPSAGLVTIKNCVAYGLRALSNEYVTDGGFVEFYDWDDGAIIENNIVYDSQNFTETGRSAGSGRNCSNITIRRNVMWKGEAVGVEGESQGLIMRSATNSLIAHNTFVGLDDFVFDIADQNGGNGFAGLITNLVIKNNIGSSTVHPMSLDNVLTSTGVVINYNDLWNTEGGSFAWNAVAGSNQTFAQWKSTTGYEANGLNVAATFVNAAGNDYSLTPASAGVDDGQIGVLADGYNGSAPDMGAFETGDETVVQKYGQARARIKRTYRSHAQAQAMIPGLAARRVHAQAQAQVINPFLDGFETGDLSKWDVVQQTDGDVIVEGAAAKNGSFGAHIIELSNGAATYIRKNIGATNSIRASGWFRSPTEGAGGNNNANLRIFSSGTRIADVYRQNVTGGIWLRTLNSSDAFVYTDTGITRSLNTWYHLDIYVNYNGANSRIIVKVDGKTYINKLHNLKLGAYTQLQVGAEHPLQYLDVDADDIYLIAATEAPSDLQHGQAQARIKAVGKPSGQAQAMLFNDSVTRSGQAQARIKQTYRVHAQTQARIKNTYRGHAQTQARVGSLGRGQAQAQALIQRNQTYVHGQALALIGVTDGVYTAIDELVADVSDYAVSPLSGTNILRLKLESASTPTWAKEHKLSVRAQRGALTVSLYEGASLRASFTPTLTASWDTYSYSLSSAEIASITNYSNLFIELSATGRVLVAWAELLIPSGGDVVTRLAYGQTQARIKQVYRVHAQAQADILQDYVVHGQAQARIVQEYNVHGQAQARIKNTYVVHGQAQARIKNTYRGHAQAQAIVVNSSLREYGQALARIKGFIYSPIADISIGNWLTANGDSTVDLWAEIDDYPTQLADVAQDAIYLSSSPLDTYRAKLTLGHKPNTTANHYIRWDIIVEAGAGSVGSIKLFQGDTVITTISDLYQSQPMFEVPFEYTLTTDEVNSITDYSDLYIEITGQGSTNDPVVAYMIAFEAPPGTATSRRAYGQAQAKIKSIGNVVHGQAQVWIETTERVHAQAQAQIKITYNVHGQAQARIKNTYNVHGQAQARIKQVYLSHGQAQAAIKQTYRVYAQANAWIEQTYFAHGQAQARIKNVYFGLGQAQGTIETVYNVHGQSQARIKQTYNVHAQARAWIEQSYYALGQAQATVKTTYRAYAQAQGQIKTNYVAHGQAQGQIKQVYFTHAQAQTRIKNIYNVHGQAQGTIKQTYRAFAQAQATIRGNAHGQAQGWIEQTYFSLGQAQARIKNSYTAVGQSQAWIEQTYFGLGQAQAQIKASYVVHGQARATIEQTYTAHGQTQAQIKQSYYVHGQANAWIENSYFGLGQANAWIEQSYYGLGQAQADIKQVYIVHGQAQADIKQTYRVYGQAQATIKNTYFVHGQTQATVKTTYAVHAQAQAKINAFGVMSHGQAMASLTFVGNAVSGQAQAKINAFGYPQHAQAQGTIEQIYRQHAQAQANIEQTYSVVAQSAAWIENTYTVHGQTQADILQTYRVHGQATAHIEATYSQHGQAQATIENTYVQHGQSQATIEQTYVIHGQAQGWIRNTYQVYGQANAKIHAFGINVHAQAQAYIIAGTTVHAQAQGYIKAIGVNSYGQAQAWVETSYINHGQAQSDIKQTYRVYGQVNALIGVRAEASGQAQAQIKSTSNQYGQAQAAIEQTYRVYGQTQAVIRQTYAAHGQANADIILLRLASAQAQAVILTANTVSGQAQADVLAVYRVFGQAQARVRAVYSGSGQATAVVRGRYSVSGQAQATITNGGYAFGQAQAQIVLIGLISLAQAQAVIVKAALYGQAQAYIYNPHTLKNVRIDDDSPLSTRLDDDANTVSLEDEQESVRATITNDTLSTTLDDDSSFTLTLDDEAF